MKERLIELIKSSSQYVCLDAYLVERIADYLLANGVIVPPCKMGDTAYRIVEMGTGIKYKFLGKYEGGESRGCKIAPCEEKTKRFIRSVTVTKNNLLDVCENFGKTVFLTKEEAEAELLKRSKENA